MIPGHLPGWEQYEEFVACDYVQGAAFAVRRSLWERLGGLDERFYPAYFEEADFCKRAKDEGAEVGVVTSASLIHHQDPAGQVASARFLRMLFRGRARFLIKHYSPLDWLFKYLPAELRWLRSPDSRGYRKIALGTLWEVWTGRPPREE